MICSKNLEFSSDIAWSQEHVLCCLSEYHFNFWNVEKCDFLAVFYSFMFARD